MSENFKLKRRHPYDTTVYFLDRIAEAIEKLNADLKSVALEDMWIYDGAISKTIAELEWAIAGLREHHRYAQTTHI